MAARRRRSKAEKDLTERQRYWLKHLRATDRSGEPLTAYARRLGLSEQSMYQAKSRLRAYGLIAPAIARKTSKTAPPRFTRVLIEPRETAPLMSLRVRLASGAVLEWSEAPQGDALRELLGLVS